MKYVVKLGGAGLETPSLLQGSKRAITELVRDGNQVAVVHGGGVQLTLRSAAGVAADVRANDKTSTPSDYKTSENAVILFRVPASFGRFTNSIWLAVLAQ